jgi:hypothetical protein
MFRSLARTLLHIILGFVAQGFVSDTALRRLQNKDSSLKVENGKTRERSVYRIIVRETNRLRLPDRHTFRYDLLLKLSQKRLGVMIWN